jgi:hypothetical protein
MTDNENTKMKTITITTATIDFGDWKLTATGVLDEYYDWKIERTTPSINYSSDYTTRESFDSQEELEAWMWEEVQRINQKYSHCVFEEETEEVENEDYYEEDED